MALIRQKQIVGAGGLALVNRDDVDIGVADGQTASLLDDVFQGEAGFGQAFLVPVLIVVLLVVAVVEDHCVGV